MNKNDAIDKINVMSEKQITFITIYSLIVIFWLLLDD